MRKTLRKIREGSGDVQWPQVAYFGFYTVDCFDCPSFTMFTANDCPRAVDILYHRTFEPMSMKLWCRLASIASGIFDIGAHVGVYSLAAASLRPDLPVHAFEPNPYAYARLRVHKNVNGFLNIVEHRCALGDATGVTQLTWSHKSGLPISSGATIADHGNEEIGAQFW